jgi:hypothetical protein
VLLWGCPRLGRRPPQFEEFPGLGKAQRKRRGKSWTVWTRAYARIWVCYAMETPKQSPTNFHKQKLRLPPSLMSQFKIFDNFVSGLFWPRTRLESRSGWWNIMTEVRRQSPHFLFPSPLILYTLFLFPLSFLMYLRPKPTKPNSPLFSPTFLYISF